MQKAIAAAVSISMTSGLTTQAAFIMSPVHAEDVSEQTTKQQDDESATLKSSEQVKGSDAQYVVSKDGSVTKIEKGKVDLTAQKILDSKKDMQTIVQDSNAVLLVLSDKALDDTYGALSDETKGGVHYLTYMDSQEADKAYDAFTKAGLVTDYNKDVTSAVYDQMASTDTSAITDKVSTTSVKKDGTTEYKSAGSSPVVVAVIDTGIDYTNEALRGRLVRYDESRKGFTVIRDDEIAYPDADSTKKDKSDNQSDKLTSTDSTGHGTAMAEIIARNTSSNVYIYPVKAFSDSGEASTASAYYGIKDATDKNADYILLSFAGKGKSALLQKAVDNANAKGIQVIAAAGNKGEKTDDYTPANLNHVIVAGSAQKVQDDDGKESYIKPSYANAGKSVDYVTDSSYDSENGQHYQGTSVAAAKVAAYEATAGARLGTLYSDAVMQASVDDIGDSGRDDTFGLGLVNVEKLNENIDKALNGDAALEASMRKLITDEFSIADLDSVARSSFSKEEKSVELKVRAMDTVRSYWYNLHSEGFKSYAFRWKLVNDADLTDASENAIRKHSRDMDGSYAVSAISGTVDGTVKLSITGRFSHVTPYLEIEQPEPETLKSGETFAGFRNAQLVNSRKNALWWYFVGHEDTTGTSEHPFELTPYMSTTSSGVNLDFIKNSIKNADNDADTTKPSSEDNDKNHESENSEESEQTDEKEESEKEPLVSINEDSLDLLSATVWKTYHYHVRNNGVGYTATFKILYDKATFRKSGWSWDDLNQYRSATNYSSGYISQSADGNNTYTVSGNFTNHTPVLDITITSVPAYHTIERIYASDADGMNSKIYTDGSGRTHYILLAGACRGWTTGLRGCTSGGSRLTGSTTEIIIALSDTRTYVNQNINIMNEYGKEDPSIGLFDLKYDAKDGYGAKSWSSINNEPSESWHIVKDTKGTISNVRGLKGYEFSSFSSNVNGNHEFYANNSNDVNIYMKLHNYTITYDYAGGKDPGGNPSTYTIKSPDIRLNNPTRDGYEFVGWVESGGSNTPTTTMYIRNGSSGDKHFTARWHRLPAPGKLRQLTVDKDEGYHKLRIQKYDWVAAKEDANFKETSSQGGLDHHEWQITYYNPDTKKTETKGWFNSNTSDTVTFINLRPNTDYTVTTRTIDTRGNVSGSYSQKFRTTVFPVYPPNYTISHTYDIKSDIYIYEGDVFNTSVISSKLDSSKLTSDMKNHLQYDADDIRKVTNGTGKAYKVGDYVVKATAMTNRNASGGNLDERKVTVTAAINVHVIKKGETSGNKGTLIKDDGIRFISSDKIDTLKSSSKWYDSISLRKILNRTLRISNSASETISTSKSDTITSHSYLSYSYTDKQAKAFKEAYKSNSSASLETGTKLADRTKADASWKRVDNADGTSKWQFVIDGSPLKNTTKYVDDAEKKTVSSKTDTSSAYVFDSSGYAVESAFDGKGGYQLENGTSAFGFKAINGNIYYFDNNGQMYKATDAANGYIDGFKTINGSTYYFDQYGHMHTGWLILNVPTKGEGGVTATTTAYYLGNDGKLVKHASDRTTVTDGTNISYIVTPGNHVEMNYSKYPVTIDGLSAMAVYNYNIAFDANGGKGTMESMNGLSSVESYQLRPNTFTRDGGYVFAGWSTSRNGSKSYNDSQTVYAVGKKANETVTLYAIWSGKGKMASFNGAGGGDGDSITRMPGEKLGTLPSPKSSKPHHTFAGWYTETEGGTKVTPDTTMPSTDVTYFAHWTENTYNITLDANGGKVSPTTVARKYGDEIGSLPRPTWNDSHIFLGWTKVKNDPSTVVMKNDTVNDSGMTLYAAWENNCYTIEFDSNGGSALDPVEVAPGSAIGTLPVPTRNGYALTGWYDDAGSKFSASTPVTKNYYLIARWTPVNYTISYNLNGGSVTGNPTSYTIESNTITLKNPTRNGYTFTGWSGTALTGSSNMTVTIAKGSTGNRSYTANWRANEYYLDLNGIIDGVTKGNIADVATADVYLDDKLVASGVTDFYQKVRVGTKYEIKNIKLKTNPNDPPYPVKYTMTGSNVPLSGTMPGYDYQVNISFNTNNFDINGFIDGTADSQYITHDIPLSADLYVDGKYVGNMNSAGLHWNNYDNDIFTYIKPGSSYELKNIKAKSGYYYGGLASGSSAVKSTIPSSGLIDIRFVLYHTNTVSYNANGGSGSMAAQTATYAHSFVTRQNAFTRNGYVFNGWNEKADGTGTAWNLTSAGVYENGNGTKGWTWTYNRNITLYAQWKPVAYTISYNLNGGTAIGNPDTYTIETPTFTLNAPARTGYTFTGWTPLNSDLQGSSLDSYTELNPFVTANCTTNSKRDIILGNEFAVTPGKKYRVYVTAKRVSGDLPMYGGLWYTAQTSGDSFDGYHDTTYAKLSDAGNGYAIYYRDVTVPSGKSKAKLYVQIEQDHTTGTTSYHLYGMHVVDMSTTSGTPSSVTIAKGSTGNKGYAANWSSNAYSIHFNANGGSGTMANEAMMFDTSKALTANAFTKDGYDFAGWATSASGNVVYSDGQSVKNLTNTKNGTVTLYAKWKVHTYTISYNLNGGSNPGNPTTYTIETPTFTLKAPSKAGYKFVRWYEDKSIAAGWIRATVTSITKGTTGNKRLTAEYKKLYTVTYEDWFVDANNNRKVKLGSTTRSKEEGSTANGTDIGSDTTLSKYYSYYAYHGSSDSVKVNSDVTVYRYFWAWTDLNIFSADGQQSGGTVTFGIEYGKTNSSQTVSNESNTIQPYGTTYSIEDYTASKTGEIFDSDRTDEYFDSINSNDAEYHLLGIGNDYKQSPRFFTPKKAGLSMNIYMRKTKVVIDYDANGGSYVNGPNKMPYREIYSFDQPYDISYYSSNGLTVPSSMGGIGLPNPAITKAKPNPFFRYKKDGYWVDDDTAWLVGSGDPDKADKIVNDEAPLGTAQDVANFLGCSIAKNDCYKTLYVNWQKNNQIYSYVSSVNNFSKPALYSIKSALNTARELDVYGNPRDKLSSGLNVDIANGNELTHESSFYKDDRYWLIWKNSDGSYTFINYKSLYDARNPLALDMNATISSGTNVQAYTYNGSNNQKWQITATGDKQFKISPFTDSSLALDVSGASDAPGTNVTIHTSHNGQNQRWYFDKVGDLSEVYDESFYKNKYADLKNAFGDNGMGYVTHFLEYGMFEGRQGNAKFNPSVYKSNYGSEIANHYNSLYGDTMKNYYIHYLVWGIHENRVADKAITSQPYSYTVNGHKHYYW